MATSVPSSEDFLAHYGKKGMKWGKRMQKGLESDMRVAKGTGTIRDNLRAAGKTSLVSYVKDGGNKGAAQARAVKTIELKQRAQSGQASARDMLVIYGNLSIGEILRSSPNK